MNASKIPVTIADKFFMLLISLKKIFEKTVSVKTADKIQITMIKNEDNP